MFNLERNEKVNNILFVAAYLFSIFVLVLFPETSPSIIVFLVFLHLGAAIYGLISKNPLKSYLFGFLIHPVFMILNSIYAFIVYSTPIFSDVTFSSLVQILIYSVIWGFPGFFTAQNRSNKFLFALCLLAAFVFILIQWALTYRPW